MFKAYKRARLGCVKRPFPAGVQKTCESPMDFCVARQVSLSGINIVIRNEKKYPLT
jgi:hypothetical protein